MQQAVQAVDFTSFVFAQGDDIKTTSLIIAEKFGKSHPHVLRDIERIITQVSDLFYKTNFGLIENETILAASGGVRKDKAYELTKDGFIMVVMSYTGAKAFAIKEAYINAFNFMYEKLFSKEAAPSTITEEMQRHIQEMVKAQQKRTGVHWQTIYDRFKTDFEIPRYNELPISKYAEACLWFGCKVKYDLPQYVSIDVRELEDLQAGQIGNYVVPTGEIVLPEKRYLELVQAEQKMKSIEGELVEKPKPKDKPMTYREWVDVMDKMDAGDMVLLKKIV